MSKKEKAIDEMTLELQGDRIKYARLKKNLTQEQVASQSKTITQSNLSGWERNVKGLERIRVPKIIELSSILGVSIDWLLTGKEKKVSKDGKILALGDNYAPILKWHEIHSWKFLGKENMNLNQKESVLLHGIDSKNCFALEIENKDYDYKGAFKAGDTLIIDSEKTPQVGNFVIVSHDTGNNIYIRKVNENGFLSGPDDLKFEKITSSTIFYGVVISKITKMAI